VGSDFIRSVLDMFVYGRDELMFIGAGIAPEWVSDPADTVRVAGVQTPYGRISYRVFGSADRRTITYRFDEVPRAPRDGYVIRSPAERPIRAVGGDLDHVLFTPTVVRLTVLPRELILSY
jgi:hypothetical protein